MPRIIFNKLLNGWFIVRGSHDTPISGRFETKDQAKQWLKRKGVSIRTTNRYISDIYRLDNGKTVYKFN